MFQENDTIVIELEGAFMVVTSQHVPSLQLLAS